MKSRDKPHWRRAATRPGSLWPVVSLVLLVAAVLAAPARADAPSPNVPVTPDGGSLAFQDPTLAVDPTNHAHLAIAYYDYSQGRQCSLALSSDAGQTWSIKVVVGDGGQIPLTGEQAKCVSPKIAYGPAETLYYIYQAPRAPGSNPRQVLIATSHDGGATFGPPVLLDPTTARFVYEQVAVAVDQVSGRVYAAWSDFTNQARRVMVASSTDQGQTFSTPVQVSAQTQTNVPDEPSLIVEPDHRLLVGFRVFVKPGLNRSSQQCLCHVNVRAAGDGPRAARLLGLAGVTRLSSRRLARRAGRSGDSRVRAGQAPRPETPCPVRGQRSRRLLGRHVAWNARRGAGGPCLS